MYVTLLLNENDYLTYQLYTASKNKRSRNNRRKSWLILSVGFLLLGIGFINSNEFYAYYFLGAGIISLIFYPFYQRYKYKKHYHKYVLDNLQYRFGKECKVNFQSDFIETKDITGESKINTSEVTQINEIGTHYFIKVKTGESLIIPKSIINKDSFISELMTVFQNPNIVINRELNWRWK